MRFSFFLFNVICIKGISHLIILQPVTTESQKVPSLSPGAPQGKDAIINYISPQSHLPASESPLLTGKYREPASLWLLQCKQLNGNRLKGARANYSPQ